MMYCIERSKIIHTLFANHRLYFSFNKLEDPIGQDIKAAENICVFKSNTYFLQDLVFCLPLGTSHHCHFNGCGFFLCISCSKLEEAMKSLVFYKKSLTTELGRFVDCFVYFWNTNQICLLESTVK